MKVSVLWYHGRRPGPFLNILCPKLCPDFVGYDSLQMSCRFVELIFTWNVWTFEVLRYFYSHCHSSLGCELWATANYLSLQNILSHFVQLNPWLHILLLSSDYSIVCCLVIYIFFICCLRGRPHITYMHFWPFLTPPPPLYSHSTPLGDPPPIVHTT